MRTRWVPRSRSPRENQVGSAAYAVSSAITCQLSSCRPQPRSASLPPPRVYIDRVQVRADPQAVQGDVVGGVADHGDRRVRIGPAGAENEAGAPDSAGQDHDLHADQCSTASRVAPTASLNQWTAWSGGASRPPSWRSDCPGRQPGADRRSPCVLDDGPVVDVAARLSYPGRATRCCIVLLADAGPASCVLGRTAHARAADRRSVCWRSPWRTLVAVAARGRRPGGRAARRRLVELLPGVVVALGRRGSSPSALLIILLRRPAAARAEPPVADDAGARPSPSRNRSTRSSSRPGRRTGRRRRVAVRRVTRPRALRPRVGADPATAEGWGPAPTGGPGGCGRDLRPPATDAMAARRELSRRPQSPVSLR